MGDTMMDKVDAYFKMSERKTNFSQEFRGGVATFLAMVYIVVVNADILSSSGGPCPDDRKVMFAGAEMTCEAGEFNFFFDPTGCYLECVAETKKSLITVTALCASIATLAMGVFANVPFALAPGMGLNAYFTYTVVGFMGSNSKNIDWKTAITAVFIEGLFFFVLSVTGARGFISRAIPKSIKLATTGGIGMFLAHLGLQTAEGIGMVVGDVATGITLGGCKPEYRHNLWMCSHGNITSAYRGDPAAFAGLDDNGVPNPVIYDPPPPNFCVGSSTYTCDIDPGFAPGWQGGGIMESPTTWLGIFGVIIITILLIKKQTASFAIITGVVFVSVLSWFKNSEVSFFEADILPTHGGMDAKTRWDYFSKVVKVEDISITSGKLDFGRFDQGDVWVAIIFFLFNDMLDTMSTLIAMANFAGLADEQGQFPGQEAAFVIDSIGTSLGALLGTSPVTTYIESAAGIEAGGRTGITSVVTAFFFFLCIFFAPILSSVPPWATGPVLIVVGAMMMKGVTKIAWDNYGEAVPAFACIIIMPLTYSLSWGIAAGIFTYAMVNVPSYLLDLFVFKTETWPSVYWTELFPAKTEEEAVKEPTGALTA